VIDWVAVSRHITTVSGMCFEACEIHRATGCSVIHGYVVTDGKDVSLSKRTGLTGTPCTKLKPGVCQPPPLFFDGYDPVAPLLDNDLWGGNFAAGPSGDPIIYDPAVYLFGDRESGVTNTKLFGGFSHSFLTADSAN